MYLLVSFLYFKNLPYKDLICTDGTNKGILAFPFICLALPESLFLMLVHLARHSLSREACQACQLVFFLKAITLKKIYILFYFFLSLRFDHHFPELFIPTQ